MTTDEKLEKQANKKRKWYLRKLHEKLQVALNFLNEAEQELNDLGGFGLDESGGNTIENSIQCSLEDVENAQESLE